MKRSRFTEEQIIGILKEHGAGFSAKDLCRLAITTSQEVAAGEDLCSNPTRLHAGAFILLSHEIVDHNLEDSPCTAARI